jgi:hypothetical protein
MNDIIERFHHTNDLQSFDEYVTSCNYINLSETISLCLRMGFSDGACHLLARKIENVDLCLFTALMYNDIKFVYECLQKYPVFDYKVDDYPECRVNVRGYSPLKIVSKPWILWSQSVAMLDLLLNRIPRLQPCRRLHTCAPDPNYCRCDLINFRKFEDDTLAHELIANNASGQASELLKYLLSRGLDPNVDSETGPLIHQSVFHRDFESLKLLHQSGAHLDPRDKFGHNILHLAVIIQDLDCLNYLLQQQVSHLLMQRVDDKIPLMLAWDQLGANSEVYNILLEAHQRSGATSKVYQRIVQTHQLNRPKRSEMEEER